MLRRIPRWSKLFRKELEKFAYRGSSVFLMNTKMIMHRVKFHEGGKRIIRASYAE